MTARIRKDTRDKASLWTSEFVLISLINLAVFMGFNMTNTGMPVFVDILGGTPFQVGLVMTLSTAAALATRPFTGWMVDHMSRKGILISGIVVTAVSVALFLVFPLVSAILVLRFIQGLGWGLSSTATSTVVADVLPRSRFAEGMGWFAMTTSLASAIAPALSIVLLEQAGGEVMIIVTIAFILIALIMALVGRFKRPDQSAYSTPSVPSVASKEAPVPAQAASSAEKPLAQPIQQPTTKTTSPSFPAEEKKASVLSSLFDRHAVLPSILSCLINMAFAPIATFIVLHSQEQGVTGISLYFVVYALVNIVSRPSIGRIIDRHGYFWPGLLSSIGVIVSLALIAWGQSLVVFCIAGAFCGLGFGTAMSTFQTMAVGSVHPSRRGVATSTYLFGMNGGMALGSLIAGLFVESLGYSNMYLIMAIFPIISGIVVLVVGPKGLKKYRP